MIRFSRGELKKLSALCAIRERDAHLLMESESATEFEKALAKSESELMTSLSMKLSEIMLTDAKRIEITH